MQVCESPLHSCPVCEFYSVMNQALSVVMSLGSRYYLLSTIRQVRDKDNEKEKPTTRRSVF